MGTREPTDYGRQTAMQLAGDLAKAGELQYGRIPELEKQLSEAAAHTKGAMLREEVTDEEIRAATDLRSASRVLLQALRAARGASSAASAANALVAPSLGRQEQK